MARHRNKGTRSNPQVGDIHKLKLEVDVYGSEHRHLAPYNGCTVTLVEDLGRGMWKTNLPVQGAPSTTPSKDCG